MLRVCINCISSQMVAGLLDGGDALSASQDVDYAVPCSSREMIKLLLQRHGRLFTTVSTHDIAVYHQLADRSLDRLCERLELLNDAAPRGIPGFDVEYAQGVLTLRLGPKGTFVLNKQPPNRQIWLSSPVSGPKRYDWCEKGKTWVYAREPDQSLEEELERELSRLLEVPIDLTSYSNE